LIQIAHNVIIGDHTVIAAQAGISGSTKIGSRVVIGGQAGIVGHIQIADGVKINAQSGVSKSIEITNSAVTGTPAADYRYMLKCQAVFKNLPALQSDVQKLMDQK
jgi:UDP-3-O-[3-hydroxymyristoyl] glucosamine N-acyltransferase